MPRASRVPAKLLTQKPSKVAPNAPRLWNAKERIKTSVGLGDRERSLLRESPHSHFLEQLKAPVVGRRSPEVYAEVYDRWLKLRHAEPSSAKGEDGGPVEWWKNETSLVSQYMKNHPLLSKLSEDVQSFISENPQLSSGQINRLLKNPSRYFSIPINVPYEDRRQVYFPDPKDTVTLLRTKHLGPRYAAFDVPLHFNKLDMRDYLKSVYNVDVLHIRSTITQAKVRQKPTMSKVARGYWVRSESHKKMTVLLAKPFVYPEEIKDLSEWDHKDYWDSRLEQEKDYKNRSDTRKPNDEYRTSIKSQARAAVQELKTSKDWKPTWKELVSSNRAMQGAVTDLPSHQSAIPPPSTTRTENNTKSLPLR